MGCVNSCTIKLTLLAFGLRTSTQPTSTMRPEQTHVDLNRWRNDGKYRIRCTHVQGYFLLGDRHYFVSLPLALPSLLLFGGLKATRGRWKCFCPRGSVFFRRTDNTILPSEHSTDRHTVESLECSADRHNVEYRHRLSVTSLRASSNFAGDNELLRANEASCCRALPLALARCIPTPHRMVMIEGRAHNMSMEAPRR